MPSDLFPPHVESERLQYDPLHETLPALEMYEYHRSGELASVFRALDESLHQTPKESADELASVAEAWAADERATYAIRTRTDDEFVGVAELWLEWEKRTASFGIWLREEAWGRGYATERAGAMLVVAFDVLDLEVVRVGHDPDNDRSRRAIESYVDAYGGREEGLLRNWLPPGESGEPRDLQTYTIGQEQWRAAVTEAELASVSVERP